jgi:hypothetical protein
MPRRYKQNAFRILQFLVVLERPLRIEEAVDAIAVELEGNPPFDPENRMPNPKEISRYCSSLVAVVTRRIGKEDQNMITELQLAHLSVKEYLTSDRADKDSMQFFQETAAKACITKVSLAYLSCLSEQTPIEEIAAKFPLAEYSTEYWMDHARSVETEKDVQKRILDFFLRQSQAYAIWDALFDPSYRWGKERVLGRNWASPLYHASRAGLLRTVELLLEKGAYTNIPDAFHEPLLVASFQGHKEIVQLLIEKGADVNARGYGTFRNPLIAASSHGHQEIVQLLIEKGADVNARVYGMFSNALTAASSHGHQEIVQLLIEKGADVNACDDRRFGNALTTASSHGHQEIVQLPIEKETDVNTSHDDRAFDLLFPLLTDMKRSCSYW